jgi:hypothetical protein
MVVFTEFAPSLLAKTSHTGFGKISSAYSSSQSTLDDIFDARGAVSSRKDIVQGHLLRNCGDARSRTRRLMTLPGVPAGRLIQHCRPRSPHLPLLALSRSLPHSHLVLSVPLAFPDHSILIFCVHSTSRSFCALFLSSLCRSGFHHCHRRHCELQSLNSAALSWTLSYVELFPLVVVDLDLHAIASWLHQFPRSSRAVCLLVVRGGTIEGGELDAFRIVQGTPYCSEAVVKLK